MVCQSSESTPSDGIGPWVGRTGPAWDGMGNRPTVIHRLWISLGKMWMGPWTSWGWPRKSPEDCGVGAEEGAVRPVDDGGRPPMPSHPGPSKEAGPGQRYAAMGRHGPGRPGEGSEPGWHGRMDGRMEGKSARWPVSRVLYPAPKGRRWPFVWGAGCPDASRDQPERRRGNALDPRPSRCGDGGRAAPIRSCSRWGLPCRPRCRVRGALLPHPFTLTRVETLAVCFLWHFP